MEYRNVIITKPARLSVRNSQLLVQQEQEVSIPMEDICTLMIESPQVSVSSAALEQLAVSGVTVFFCDRTHLPSAQLLAFNQFSRKKKLLFEQFDMGKPLRKQLWKCVVQQKIHNQAQCLRLLKRPGAEHMDELAATVRSGDVENVEATAAQFYFPALFGKGFVRREDNLENAVLNYGYAIVRGCIARNLVMHGLEPCVGIFHSSELNQFNLADDLIEPYRPLVDLLSAKLCQTSQAEELTPAIKRELFGITNKLVFQADRQFRVMTSVDRMAASYAASVLQGNVQLELPEVIGTEDGRFE